MNLIGNCILKLKKLNKKTTMKLKSMRFLPDCHGEMTGNLRKE
jgi:hypothetical protein